MTYKREQINNDWIDYKRKKTIKDVEKKIYKTVRRMNGSGYFTSCYISLPVCCIGKRVKIKVLKRETQEGKFECINRRKTTRKRIRR